MLTAVGKKIILMSSTALPGGDVGKGAIIEMKDIKTGSIFYTNGYPNDQSMTLANSAITLTGSRVYVGSGSTPATENDWFLESPLVNNEFTANHTSSYTLNSDKTIMYVNNDYVITNQTQNEITIREIGRAICVYTSTTKGDSVSSTKKAALVDRTVLETPVVIPAGEAATVRYQFAYDVS